MRGPGLEGQPGPEATDWFVDRPLLQPGQILLLSIQVASSPGGPRPSPGFWALGGGQRAWWRGPRRGTAPSSWSSRPPSWKFPGRGTGRAACLVPPAAPSQREQGQRGEAADLAGRLCFQSWLSRAGAGEHTVPIRSPVLCCMCFHGLGGGVGREIPFSITAARV